GISLLFEGMAAEVRKARNCILLEAPAVKLERTGDRITSVVYSHNGRTERIECDGVLSTVPLPQPVFMLSQPRPATVGEDSRTPRYGSVKLIYVALKRPRLTDFHWVYLLDEQFRVNRVSEQKNVSPHMVPDDRTVLCIELSLWRDEPLWNATDEEIYK